MRHPRRTHRHLRHLVALVTVTGLTWAIAGTISSPAQAAPSPTTQTGTIAELIAKVPVAPPLYVGYRGVEQFIPKAVALKKDSRGCNLRQRTIIALASIKPTVRSKCRMSGGTWVINGGTTTVKSPKGLLVQPVIDYKTAWGQGAYAWTPAQRLAWATNTGPTSSLRGKAVNVQATQTLIDINMAASTQELASEAKTRLATNLDAMKTLVFCLGNVWCLISALTVYGMDTASIRDEAVNSCTGTGARVSNLLAWGLSVDAATARAISLAAEDCKTTYTIGNETKPLGIVPVAPTSTVSATYVEPSTDAVPRALFNDYPTTAPEGITSAQAFGLMAPIDWAAPTVGWGFTRVWDSGASWRQVETSKGVYNWSKMDAIVARANSTGSAVMYVLGDTPGWANGGKAGNVPPTDLNDAGRFIAAMCSKYKGSVALYEAWNEGNILDFWSGTMTQLADLTASVRGAVADCGAGTKVLASSAGARAEGGLATRYKPYLDALKAKSWPVDGFAVHSYPKANGTPVQRGEILQQWKAMLSGSGAPDLLLYDTELNYGLAGLGQPKKAITDAQGAEWLMQSYIQSQQYGLDGTSWFVWTGAGTDDKVGIQMNTASTKVNQGWSTVRSWLDGSSMYRCAQRNELFGCQLTLKDGKKATALWMVAGGTQTMQVGTLGTQLCTIDACTPISGTSITVTGSPILVKAG